MSDSSDFESEPEDSPWGKDYSITDPTRVVLTRTVRPGTFSYKLYQPLFDLGWEIKQKYNKYLKEEKEKALMAKESGISQQGHQNTEELDSDSEIDMTSDGEGPSERVNQNGEGTSALVKQPPRKVPEAKKSENPGVAQNALLDADLDSSSAQQQKMSDSSDFDSEPNGSPRDLSITDSTRVTMIRTVGPGEISYNSHQAQFDLGWEIKQKYNKFLEANKKRELKERKNRMRSRRENQDTEELDSDSEMEIASDGEGPSENVTHNGQGISALVSQQRKEAPKTGKRGKPRVAQNAVQDADFDSEILRQAATPNEERDLVMELRDWTDVTANGMESRNRLDRQITEVMFQSHHPKKDYIAFMERYVAKFDKILHLYKSDYHFKKMREENSAILWSQESMTEVEHERHFTRMDAAIMNAKKAILKRDIAKANRGGFIGLSATEEDFCKWDAKVMEGEVNEKKKEYKEWFTFSKFSLADALERSSNESLFKRSIHYITGFRTARQSDSHVHRIFTNSSAAKSLTEVLKRNGLDYTAICEELTRGLRQGYTLPKGKLYCRLILNVASLAYFDIREDEWDCMKFENNEEYENWVFRGIPFDANGRPYTFHTVATDPTAPSTSNN